METDDNTMQITIGSKKYPLVITLKEFKGRPLVDIRKYFLDKSSKEIKPTKKGIALQKNNYKLLLEALVSSSEQIDQWLEKQSHSTMKKAEQVLKSRVEALEANRRDAQKFEIEKSQWKAPNFFEVESLGGKDKVIFNDSHLLVQKLNKVDDVSADKTLEIISNILIAYSKSKDVLDGNEEYTAAELFRYLEYEWGQILANYLSQAAE